MRLELVEGDRPRPQHARGSSVQSMIVDPLPSPGPPSRIASSSPARRSATSEAVAQAASPWRLALVTASGPVRRSSSRSSGCPGTRTSSVVPVRGTASPLCGVAASTSERPPGQNAAARRRAVRVIPTSGSRSAAEAASSPTSIPSGRRLTAKTRARAAGSSGRQAMP